MSPHDQTLAQVQQANGDSPQQQPVAVSLVKTRSPTALAGGVLIEVQAAVAVGQQGAIVVLPEVLPECAVVVTVVVRVQH